MPLQSGYRLMWAPCARTTRYPETSVSLPKNPGHLPLPPWDSGTPGGVGSLPGCWVTQAPFPGSMQMCKMLPAFRVMCRERAVHRAHMVQCTGEPYIVEARKKVPCEKVIHYGVHQDWLPRQSPAPCVPLCHRKCTQHHFCLLSSPFGCAFGT